MTCATYSKLFGPEWVGPLHGCAGSSLLRQKRAISPRGRRRDQFEIALLTKPALDQHRVTRNWRPSRICPHSTLIGHGYPQACPWPECPPPDSLASISRLRGFSTARVQPTMPETTECTRGRLGRHHDPHGLRLHGARITGRLD